MGRKLHNSGANLRRNIKLRVGHISSLLLTVPYYQLFMLLIRFLVLAQPLNIEFKGFIKVTAAVSVLKDVPIPISFCAFNFNN